MAKNKSWLNYRTGVFFLLLTGMVVLQNNAAAQSIFLEDDIPDGAIALGGFAHSEEVSGPVAGFSYSVNGMLDFGAAYSTFSTPDVQLRSVAISSSILFSKQYNGDLFNFELIPTIQRGYGNSSGRDLDQTIVTLGVAISRDLVSEGTGSKHFLVPRLGFMYSNYFIDGNNTYPSKGIPNDNFYAASIDLTGGLNLTSNSKFIVNSGFTYNIKDDITGWALTAGFLFY